MIINLLSKQTPTSWLRLANTASPCYPQHVCFAGKAGGAMSLATGNAAL